MTLGGYRLSMATVNSGTARSKVRLLKRLGCRVVLMAMALTAVACGRAGTAPPASPTPLAAAVPSPPRQSIAFDMTGVVADDEGAPVPGAHIAVQLDYEDLASMLTDASGAYKVNFTGVPGSNHLSPKDPPGTEDAVAFAVVEATGYEPYARYILGADPHLIENIRLHRIKRITAGDSAVLTVAADDTVCVTDAWPGRELICGTLRVVVPSNGTMSVEAVPTQAASGFPILEVYGGGTGAPRTNPTAFRVAAGTEYTVKVEVASGLLASQSFVVKTSMTGR